MRRAILDGKRFERLTVLRVHSVAKSPCGTKRLKWLCRCDCGNEHIVRGADLVNGLVRSCGCLKDELARARLTTHGHTGGGKVSKEYNAWHHAKRRCSDPSESQFCDYGGRGIRMCQRWADSFEAFLADMGPCQSGKSLDRIDVDGHYEPDNCRWATRLEQMNNMRTSRYVVLDGKRMTVAEASRLRGIRSYLVYGRLKSGWSIERALSEPVKK
jgi:hypothetical protein